MSIASQLENYAQRDEHGAHRPLHPKPPSCYREICGTSDGPLLARILSPGYLQERLRRATAGLPKFGNKSRLRAVSTMNISLPDDLKSFVDEQVKRGYGTSSEYVRELIRKDQDQLRLRELLLAGAASASAAPADAAYFKKLRNRSRGGRTASQRR